MTDKTKQYKTRDGRDVRIYATDGKYPLIVHGAVHLEEGWKTASWTNSGKFNPYIEDDGSWDLIEVKPRIKRTVWIAVLPTCCLLYHTKEWVDNTDGVLACVCVDIDVEEGEGL